MGESEERCDGIEVVGPAGWAMPTDAEPFHLVLARALACVVCGRPTVRWNISGGLLWHWCHGDPGE